MEFTEDDEEEENDDFPWQLGVFDSHCHPTDTMSEISNISKMRAAALTIMATRDQDQCLVANVSQDIGLDSAVNFSTGSSSRVVPSFGWHPWFSHQLYVDDSLFNGNGNTQLDMESKIAHYQAVLTPKPEDTGFLAALPDPVPLSSFITQTQKRLVQYPCALVGEIGLDKAFRLPRMWLPEEVNNRDSSLTPGGREGRTLSPYRVSLEHQRRILLAQLKLAGRMKRPVSVHGVQAHGVLFETLQETWAGYEKKILSKRQRKRASSAPYAHASDGASDASSQQENEKEVQYPPRICLHSYSGSPEPIRQYVNSKVPAAVYFSFSMLVNFSTPDSSKTEQVIRAVPNDRILVESDMHIAGPEMDRNLKKITKKVCALKGWDLTEGVKQLGENWKDFVFGIAHCK